MTGPPVSQEDVNTLTFINLLVTGLCPSSDPPGVVKLGRRKNELGVVEYRATATGFYHEVSTFNGKSVELVTDLIEVQVAPSRSEVLMKLLDAVEDYFGEKRFPKVSDETESEKGYTGEQPPREPDEDGDGEDFRKIMQQMSRGAAEDEYDLLKSQQITQQKGS